jgi:spermidine synthase
MTRAWQLLDCVDTEEGSLELHSRGDTDFLIVVDGRVLMQSVAHRSEIELAVVACRPLAQARRPRVLIGGLGMGYTLRAALDELPSTAEVTVAEITARIVDWCRGPLGPLTRCAVDEPRVQLQIGDVADVIAKTPATARWDAIVLDLYEGPYVATQRPDDPLFGKAALRRTLDALAPGGTLSIWSEDHEQAFERRLRSLATDVELISSGRGGRRHTIYVARRPSSSGARR